MLFLYLLVSNLYFPQTYIKQFKEEFIMKCNCGLEMKMFSNCCEGSRWVAQCGFCEDEFLYECTYCDELVLDGFVEYMEVKDPTFQGFSGGQGGHRRCMEKLVQEESSRNKRFLEVKKNDLKRLIDESLDAKDKDSFIKYSNKLNDFLN
jgi:hypothetical protein